MSAARDVEKNIRNIAFCVNANTDFDDTVNAIPASAIPDERGAISREFPAVSKEDA